MPPGVFMLRRQSITFQLSLFIMSSVVIVFTIMFGYMYRISRAMVMRGVEQDAQQIAEATLQRIETRLSVIQKIAWGMTHAVQNMPGDRRDLERYLKAVVEDNPEIYGAVIAFEPYAFAPDVKLLCPYYCKLAGKLTYVDLGNESYNYHQWPWYTQPRELNRAVWSDPYFDEGGGGIMLATYAAPFYSIEASGKRFRGVVTADVSLDWLKDLCDSVRIYQTGYAFLLSTNGTFIAHPDASLVMKETVFSVARQRQHQELEQAGRRMVSGEKGFVIMPSLHTGKISFLYFMPLSVNGWVLGVLFPQDEFMAEVSRLGKIVLALAVAGFILLLAVIFLIARSITRPLKLIAEAAEAVAAGRIGDAGRVVGAMPGAQRRPEAAGAGRDPGPSARPAGPVRNEMYRLREAIGAMIQSLESVVSQMRKSGIQVTASGAQIDASARRLESAVNRQASSIAEAGATSKEISSTARVLAQDMDQVTRSASEAAALADGGVTRLADMKTAIQGLLQSTEQIASKLGLISRKTATIDQVVTTITKVANQTNLLSLNASIEADKAGEYGLGFAVVAREIRRLADQTAVAALDIESMVVEMRAEVAGGVSAMESYSGQAQAGSDKIVKLSGDLGRIIDQTRRLSGRFEAVNASMKTQSQGASQISQAMEQLGEIARLTRESLSEFQSVTGQMSEAVRGLQGEVARFSVRAQ